MRKIFLIVFTLLVTSSIAQKKDYVVTISTTYGNMVAILYDETPKHKANFIKLTKAHYFDSLLFHRVIKGFMIQGGDPDSKRALPGKTLGSGGPGYTVEAEFNPKFYHEKGALSAARTADLANPTKASNGSQFYIVQGKLQKADALKIDREKFNTGIRQLLSNPANKLLRDTINQLHARGDQGLFEQKMNELAPRIEKETGIKVTNDISAAKLEAYTTKGGAPHLDGAYTVFGKVISGLDVLDKIAEEQVDGNNRPNDDIRMVVTVKELSRKKITKLYGYKYPAKQ